MKKLFTILFIILFLISSNTFAQNEEQFENKNFQEVLKIDIKTLKYEQKQLVYAIITGDENSVKTILNSDPNPQTTYAKIPLTMFAIHSNKIEILKILIEDYKFNPNETIMNVTPLEIAIALKKYDAIEYLLSIGVQPNEETLKYIKKKNNKKLLELFFN